MSVLRDVWTYVLNHSLLLVVGAGAGLVWANLDATSYQAAAQVLRFGVNEVGMAFFFGLAAKEVVEATAPGGPLHSPRRAGMPLLAAIGGMVGPALIYVALCLLTEQRGLLRGWAIPCATDIAFSYLVARVAFGKDHPAIPFLLLLAIADDALGLVILAAFYPSGPVHPLIFVALLSLAIGIAILLRRRRTRSFWPYILGAGAVSWFALHEGGLHPALALVPIIPFVPHASRDAGLFVDAAGHDPLTEFEHWWKVPVQVILLFFGFVNAGVPLSNTGPGTWLVLIAIIAGKPIGILSFTGLGLLLGLHRPPGVSWRDLIVVGIAAAIGFTVALFFATAAFPPGIVLDEVKMGALFSFVAAPFALLAARLLRTGRTSNAVAAPTRK